MTPEDLRRERVLSKAEDLRRERAIWKTLAVVLPIVAFATLLLAPAGLSRSDRMLLALGASAVLMVVVVLIARLVFAFYGKS